MFFLLFPLYLSSTPSFPRALIPQIQALRQRKVLDRQTPLNAWQILRAVSQRVELSMYSQWIGLRLSRFMKSVVGVLKHFLLCFHLYVVSVETSTLDVFEAPVTSSAPRPHPQSPRRPQHPLPSRLNILAQPAQELGPPAQVQVCAKVSLYWVAYPEELLLSLLLLGIAQNVHLKNKLHVSAAAPGSTAINGTRPPAYFWNGQ